MPTKRSKPAWSTNPPPFLLSGKPGDDHDKNGIDLIAELTASMYDCVLQNYVMLDSRPPFLCCLHVYD